MWKLVLQSIQVPYPLIEFLRGINVEHNLWKSQALQYNLFNPTPV